MPRKGQITRTHCKIGGCDQPVYTYPNGTKASYCKPHLKFRKGVTRDGMPSMTGPMSIVMGILYAAHQADEPFAALPADTDYRTIRALTIERDWIVEVATPSGVCYTLTKRGIDAIKHHDGVICRRDGICPRCQERERHVSKNGRRIAYCLECERARCVDKAARGIAKVKPGRLCSRCKKRSVHQYSGGGYSSYCAHCERVRGRRKTRRERDRILKAVQRGEPAPLCKDCKTQPRQVFTASVSDRCRECNRVHRAKVAPVYRARTAARKAIELRRKHKICPRCKVNPRWRWATGYLEAYCHDCHLEMKVESYKAQKQRVFRVITERAGKGVAA